MEEKNDLKRIIRAYRDLLGILSAEAPVMVVFVFAVAVALGGVQLLSVSQPYGLWRTVPTIPLWMRAESMRVSTPSNPSGTSGEAQSAISGDFRHNVCS